MTEPISDEDIDRVAKEADKHYDSSAPFSSLRDVRYAFARAILRLAAERIRPIVEMTAADIQQAKANSVRPEHTGGYIAGRQEAAAEIHRVLGGDKP